ncbi:extracellular matrix regulator RemB [Heliophilum fasciatum]|uniref:Uncharacterized protein DUF370 n=1 Tax=Heliophilum fasciatum TaxID=35700 RepID=A0A4R2RML3_9FIRM|nr:extracellular matrix/biofilm biosynthesis regulator RemA family protein [Heliophilum fasciatum]MCW2278286.1 hypothetical protein [Heliophilum fasciatum]TCP63909.1 uncharacterized protein DUF370 [Heliophilum fasciatum]
MFLHLGSDVVVPKDDIVVIIDLESAAQANTTQEFIKSFDQSGKVKNIAETGKEKSFIVTRHRAYISPISSMTLMKRGNNIVTMLKAMDEGR